MRKLVFNLEPKDYSLEAVSIWRKNGYDYAEGDLDSLLVFERRSEINVLIVRLNYYISESVLSAVPAVNAIISATTGVTHLDMHAVSTRNINLISLRGNDKFLEQIPSTAEFCWGLLLAMHRNIPEALDHVQAGHWNRDILKGLQLAGRSIGLVGLGRIGSMMAKYALAFNMVVRYYDPYVDCDSVERCSSIDELFSCSNIVSLHIHADSSNKNLINEKLISLMPAHSYLINVSRGEVWDEDAVWNAIQTKKLAKVGTDVLCGEPLSISESILWQNRHHPSLFITPHLGGACFDAMWSCELFVQSLYLNSL